MLPSAENDELQRRINEIEYFLSLLEGRIQKPFRILDSDKVRGHRFAKPGIIHYVILNISNSVSVLRCLILLKDFGFRNEFMILCRSFLELQSKLSYVIGGLKLGKEDRKTESFLAEFFSDTERNIERRSNYKPLSQKDIHRRNSESVSDDIKNLNEIGLKSAFQNANNEAAKIYSDLYKICSNHVHFRYPEMMDIYGEKSAELQLNGDFESKDVDYHIENEFVKELIKGTAKRLRLSLLYLFAIGKIQLGREEQQFCLGDALDKAQF